MDRTRINHGPSCLSIIALATTLAACSGGEGPTPPGGGPGERDGGPTVAPSGHALACSVTGEATLGTGEAASPAIAFGGGRFAVAYVERGAPGLQVALLDERGASLGHQAIATGPGATEPAIAALPSGGFMVAWQENGAVRAQRLGANGAPEGGPIAITRTANPMARPEIAATPRGTAVAWTDTTSAQAGEIGANALAGTTSFAGGAEPSFAAGPDALGMVWIAGGHVGFTKLSFPLRSAQSLTLRDAPGYVNGPRAAAAPGGAFWVTWEDGRNGNEHESVYAARVEADGKVSREVRVPGDDGSANYPDIAAIGDHAAVVYYQFRDGPPAIYLTLVGPDLQPVGEDLRISGHAAARFPRIAAGGDVLGVAYAPRSGAGKVALLTCR
jgi:hypothetical protein